MTKIEILTLKKAYEVNGVSLSDLFAIACDDAYNIRYCDVAPVTQCRIRAKHLAFPFTMMLLDLANMITYQKIDN